MRGGALMSERNEGVFDGRPIVDQKTTQGRPNHTTDDARYDALMECLFRILGSLRAIVFFEGLILGVIFVKLVL